MRASVVVAVSTLLIAASIASAQCAAPSWKSMGQQPGLQAAANAVTLWDPDGAGPAIERLAIGDGNYFGGVATWDGSSWEMIPSGRGVLALTVWNGELIAARDQTGDGMGPPVSDVVRYTGGAWVPLGGQFDGLLRAFAVFNGDLIAAGTFTNTGGTAASSIARWDGAAWHPIGSGLSGGFPLPGANVNALAVFNGELIAGGNFYFYDAGGFTVGSIAKWNGTAWQALGADAGTWGVSRLLVHAGQLIAGGPAFQHAGANVALKIARWDGTQWQPLGTGLSSDVGGMMSFNGDLIVSAGAMVQRWNGVTWSPVGSNTDFASAVAAYGGEIVATRALPTGLSRFDGTAWQPLGAVFNNTVRCLTTFQDELVASGYFTAANGGIANRIARWNGASWQAMGAGFNGVVDGFTVFNGDLIAGGYFTSSGAVAIDNVARWTGSAWVPFATGPGSAIGVYGVRAVVVYNGELVIGGQFASAGGVAVNGIARWDGAAWQPLGAGLTNYANPAWVMALAVYGGDLIAAGQITTAGGVAANAIARWDGSAWHPLGSGLEFYAGGAGECAALAVSGGQLFAGGTFFEAGGAPANSVARWDGVSWHALGAGIDGPGAPIVGALALSGGDLIAGGKLWTAGGVPADKIARWDGTSWLAMGDGLDWGFGVDALAVHHGAIVAGGNFERAGGVSSPYLARWSSPLPYLAAAQPGGPGTGVEIRNAWLVPGHEYYNLASLDLSPGAPGSGPYGGLWFLDVGVLITQLSQPLGAAPFHVQAPGSSAMWGPYVVPAGVTFEAISVDVTGAQLGCIGSAVRYTVN